MRIETVKHFIEILRRGPYTSLEGYPIFFKAHDSTTYSFRYVLGHALEFGREIKKSQMGTEWVDSGKMLQWYDILYENPGSLYCEGTQEPLECAYPADTTECSKCKHDTEDSLLIGGICQECREDIETAKSDESYEREVYGPQSEF